MTIAVGSAPAGRGSLEPSRCAPATSGRVNLRGSPGAEPAFAPVVLASATSSSTPAAPLSPTIDTAMRSLIEIAIGDLTVRVRGQNAALKSERTKKRRASRNDKLDHLPHEEVVIEPDSKVCPCPRGAAGPLTFSVPG